MLPLPKGAVWQAFLVLCLVLLVREARAEVRVVCYYTNWSVYRPGTAKFNPQNINPYLCTHLIYAFGGFTKDNTLKPFDKYQDIEQGGYAKFTGLKSYNKQLKTMLAIGGWNEASSRFSPLVANPERRQQFIRNILKFLRQNHFDGLDLDWEYPAFRDGGKPRDRDNYAKFVEELRNEFDRESQKTGRPRLLLTMAVPAGIEYIEKGYDIPKLNQYLDWFNILSYDYHSAFEPSVNHHAPLYSLEEASEYNYDAELNIDYTVKFYLEAGADRDKLVLGIPTYGRSYTLINEDDTSIGAPADGPGDQGDATREKGYLAYYEICQSIRDDDSWEVVQPNENAMGPYAHRGNQWVGYDDENIVRKKSQYVAQNALGGIMFWSLDNDDFRGACSGKPYPLIEAAKEALLDALGSGANEITAPARTKSQSRQGSRAGSSPSTRNRVSEQGSAGKGSKSSGKQSSSSRRKSNKKKSSTPARTTSTTTEGSLYIGGRTTTPAPPTTPDPGADFKCEEEGFFAHPRDCKKYFWCLDSGPSNLGIVAHQFTCPSGLYFNTAADSCDFSRNVLCKKSNKDATTTTNAPSVTTAKTTTTTTTTAAPYRITAATSSYSFIQRTSTTASPIEDEEDEYDDEEPENENSPNHEEDPKVIKELIDLIKRVGGLEELEKQLHIQEDGTVVMTSSKSDQVSTTPSSISQSLYAKVLSRPNPLSALRNRLGGTKFTTKKEEVPSSSSGTDASSNAKYTSLYRNSRPSPQNAGIDKLVESEGFLKEKPKYVTINRPRVTKQDDEEPEEEEEVEDVEDDEAVEESSEATRKKTSSSYVSIQRSRPTKSPTLNTSAETDDDDVNLSSGNSKSKYQSINRVRSSTTEANEDDAAEVDDVQPSKPVSTYQTLTRTGGSTEGTLDTELEYIQSSTKTRPPRPTYQSFTRTRGTTAADEIKSESKAEVEEPVSEKQNYLSSSRLRTTPLPNLEGQAEEEQSAKSNRARPTKSYNQQSGNTQDSTVALVADDTKLDSEIAQKKNRNSLFSRRQSTVTEEEDENKENLSATESSVKRTRGTTIASSTVSQEVTLKPVDSTKRLLNYDRSKYSTAGGAETTVQPQKDDTIPSITVQFYESIIAQTTPIPAQEQDTLSATPDYTNIVRRSSTILPPTTTISSVTPQPETAPLDVHDVSHDAPTQNTFLNEVSTSSDIVAATPNLETISPTEILANSIPNTSPVHNEIQTQDVNLSTDSVASGLDTIEAVSGLVSALNSVAPSDTRQDTTNKNKADAQKIPLAGQGITLAVESEVSVGELELTKTQLNSESSPNTVNIDTSLSSNVDSLDSVLIITRTTSTTTSRPPSSSASASTSARATKQPTQSTNRFSTRRRITAPTTTTTEEPEEFVSILSSPRPFSLTSRRRTRPPLTRTTSTTENFLDNDTSDVTARSRPTSATKVSQISSSLSALNVPNVASKNLKSRPSILSRKPNFNRSPDLVESNSTLVNNPINVTYDTVVDTTINNFISNANTTGTNSRLRSQLKDKSVSQQNERNQQNTILNQQRQESEESSNYSAQNSWRDKTRGSFRPWRTTPSAPTSQLFLDRPYRPGLIDSDSDSQQPEEQSLENYIVFSGQRKPGVQSNLFTSSKNLKNIEKRPSAASQSTEDRKQYQNLNEIGRSEFATVVEETNLTEGIVYQDDESSGLASSQFDSSTSRPNNVNENVYSNSASEHGKLSSKIDAENEKSTLDGVNNAARPAIGIRNSFQSRSQFQKASSSSRREANTLSISPRIPQSQSASTLSYQKLHPSFQVNSLGPFEQNGARFSQEDLHITQKTTPTRQPISRNRGHAHVSTTTQKPHLTTELLYRPHRPEYLTELSSLLSADLSKWQASHDDSKLRKMVVRRRPSKKTSISNYPSDEGEYDEEIGDHMGSSSNIAQSKVSLAASTDARVSAGGRRPLSIDQKEQMANYDDNLNPFEKHVEEEVAYERRGGENNFVYTMREVRTDGSTSRLKVNDNRGKTLHTYQITQTNPTKILGHEQQHGSSNEKKVSLDVALSSKMNQKGSNTNILSTIEDLMDSEYSIEQVGVNKASNSSEYSTPSVLPTEASKSLNTYNNKNHVQPGVQDSKPTLSEYNGTEKNLSTEKPKNVVISTPLSSTSDFFDSSKRSILPIETSTQTYFGAIETTNEEPIKVRGSAGEAESSKQNIAEASNQVTELPSQTNLLDSSFLARMSKNEGGDKVGITPDSDQRVTTTLPNEVGLEENTKMHQNSAVPHAAYDSDKIIRQKSTENLTSYHESTSNNTPTEHTTFSPPATLDEDVSDSEGSSSELEFVKNGKEMQRNNIFLKSNQLGFNNVFGSLPTPQPSTVKELKVNPDFQSSFTTKDTKTAPSGLPLLHLTTGHIPRIPLSTEDTTVPSPLVKVAYYFAEFPKSIDASEIFGENTTPENSSASNEGLEEISSGKLKKILGANGIVMERGELSRVAYQTPSVDSHTKKDIDTHREQVESNIVKKYVIDESVLLSLGAPKTTPPALSSAGNKNEVSVSENLKASAHNQASNTDLPTQIDTKTSQPDLSSYVLGEYPSIPPDYVDDNYEGQIFTQPIFPTTSSIGSSNIRTETLQLPNSQTMGGSVSSAPKNIYSSKIPESFLGLSNIALEPQDNTPTRQFVPTITQTENPFHVNLPFFTRENTHRQNIGNPETENSPDTTIFVITNPRKTQIPDFLPKNVEQKIALDNSSLTAGLVSPQEINPQDISFTNEPVEVIRDVSSKIINAHTFGTIPVIVDITAPSAPDMETAERLQMPVNEHTNRTTNISSQNPLSIASNLLTESSNDEREEERRHVVVESLSNNYSNAFSELTVDSASSDASANSENSNVTILQNENDEPSRSSDFIRDESYKLLETTTDAVDFLDSIPTNDPNQSMEIQSTFRPQDSLEDQLVMVSKDSAAIDFPTQELPEAFSSEKLFKSEADQTERSQFVDFGGELMAPDEQVYEEYSSDAGVSGLQRTVQTLSDHSGTTVPSTVATEFSNEGSDISSGTVTVPVTETPADDNVIIFEVKYTTPTPELRKDTTMLSEQTNFSPTAEMPTTFTSTDEFSTTEIPSVGLTDTTLSSLTPTGTETSSSQEVRNIINGLVKLKELVVERIEEAYDTSGSQSAESESDASTSTTLPTVPTLSFESDQTTPSEDKNISNGLIKLPEEQEETIALSTLSPQTTANTATPTIMYGDSSTGNLATAAPEMLDSSLDHNLFAVGITNNIPAIQESTSSFLEQTLESTTTSNQLQEDQQGPTEVTITQPQTTSPTTESVDGEARTTISNVRNYSTRTQSRDSSRLGEETAKRSNGRSREETRSQIQPLIHRGRSKFRQTSSESIETTSAAITERNEDQMQPMSTIRSGSASEESFDGELFSGEVEAYTQTYTNDVIFLTKSLEKEIGTTERIALNSATVTTEAPAQIDTTLLPVNFSEDGLYTERNSNEQTTPSIELNSEFNKESVATTEIPQRFHSPQVTEETQTADEEASSIGTAKKINDLVASLQTVDFPLENDASGNLASSYFSENTTSVSLAASPSSSVDFSNDAQRHMPVRHDVSTEQPIVSTLPELEPTIAHERNLNEMVTNQQHFMDMETTLSEVPTTPETTYASQAITENLAINTGKILASDITEVHSHEVERHEYDTTETILPTTTTRILATDDPNFVGSFGKVSYQETSEQSTADTEDTLSDFGASFTESSMTTITPSSQPNEVTFDQSSFNLTVVAESNENTTTENFAETTVESLQNNYMDSTQNIDGFPWTSTASYYVADTTDRELSLNTEQDLSEMSTEPQSSIPILVNMLQTENQEKSSNYSLKSDNAEQTTSEQILLVEPTSATIISPAQNFERGLRPSTAETDSKAQSEGVQENRNYVQVTEQVSTTSDRALEGQNVSQPSSVAYDGEPINIDDFFGLDQKSKSDAEPINIEDYFKSISTVAKYPNEQETTPGYLLETTTAQTGEKSNYSGEIVVDSLPVELNQQNIHTQSTIPLIPSLPEQTTATFASSLDEQQVSYIVPSVTSLQAVENASLPYNSTLTTFNEHITTSSEAAKVTIPTFATIVDKNVSQIKQTIGQKTTAATFYTTPIILVSKPTLSTDVTQADQEVIRYFENKYEQVKKIGKSAQNYNVSSDMNFEHSSAPDATVVSLTSKVYTDTSVYTEIPAVSITPMDPTTTPTTLATQPPVSIQSTTPMQPLQTELTTESITTTSMKTTTTTTPTAQTSTTSSLPPTTTSTTSKQLPVEEQTETTVVASVETSTSPTSTPGAIRSRGNLRARVSTSLSKLSTLASRRNRPFTPASRLRLSKTKATTEAPETDLAENTTPTTRIIIRTTSSSFRRRLNRFQSRTRTTPAPEHAPEEVKIETTTTKTTATTEAPETDITENTTPTTRIIIRTTSSSFRSRLNRFQSRTTTTPAPDHVSEEVKIETTRAPKRIFVSQRDRLPTTLAKEAKTETTSVPRRTFVSQRARQPARLQTTANNVVDSETFESTTELPKRTIVSHRARPRTTKPPSSRSLPPGISRQRPDFRFRGRVTTKAPTQIVSTTSEKPNYPENFDLEQPKSFNKYESTSTQATVVSKSPEMSEQTEKISTSVSPPISSELLLDVEEPLLNEEISKTLENENDNPEVKDDKPNTISPPALETISASTVETTSETIISPPAATLAPAATSVSTATSTPAATSAPTTTSPRKVIKFVRKPFANRNLNEQSTPPQAQINHKNELLKPNLVDNKETVAPEEDNNEIQQAQEPETEKVPEKSQRSRRPGQKNRRKGNKKQGQGKRKQESITNDDNDSPIPTRRPKNERKNNRNRSKPISQSGANLSPQESTDKPQNPSSEPPRENREHVFSIPRKRFQSRTAASRFQVPSEPTPSDSTASDTPEEDENEKQTNNQNTRKRGSSKRFRSRLEGNEEFPIQSSKNPLETDEREAITKLRPVAKNDEKAIEKKPGLQRRKALRLRQKQNFRLLASKGGAIRDSNEKSSFFSNLPSQEVPRRTKRSLDDNFFDNLDFTNANNHKQIKNITEKPTKNNSKLIFFHNGLKDVLDATELEFSTSTESIHTSTSSSSFFAIIDDISGTSATQSAVYTIPTDFTVLSSSNYGFDMTKLNDLSEKGFVPQEHVVKSRRTSGPPKTVLSTTTQDKLSEPDFDPPRFVSRNVTGIFSSEGYSTRVLRQDDFLTTGPPNKSKALSGSAVPRDRKIMFIRRINNTVPKQATQKTTSVKSPSTLRNPNYNDLQASETGPTPNANVLKVEDAEHVKFSRPSQPHYSDGDDKGVSAMAKPLLHPFVTDDADDTSKEELDEDYESREMTDDDEGDEEDSFLSKLLTSMKKIFSNEEVDKVFDSTTRKYVTIERPKVTTEAAGSTNETVSSESDEINETATKNPIPLLGRTYAALERARDSSKTSGGVENSGETDDDSNNTTIETDVESANRGITKKYITISRARPLPETVTSDAALVDERTQNLNSDESDLQGNFTTFTRKKDPPSSSPAILEGKDQDVTVNERDLSQLRKITTRSYAALDHRITTMRPADISGERKDDISTERKDDESVSTYLSTRRTYIDVDRPRFKTAIESPVQVTENLENTEISHTVSSVEMSTEIPGTFISPTDSAAAAKTLPDESVTLIDITTESLIAPGSSKTTDLNMPNENSDVNLHVTTDDPEDMTTSQENTIAKKASDSTLQSISTEHSFNRERALYRSTTSSSSETSVKSLLDSSTETAFFSRTRLSSNSARKTFTSTTVTSNSKDDDSANLSTKQPYKYLTRRRLVTATESAPQTTVRVTERERSATRHRFGFNRPTTPFALSTDTPGENEEFSTRRESVSGVGQFNTNRKQESKEGSFEENAPTRRRFSATRRKRPVSSGSRRQPDDQTFISGEASVEHTTTPAPPNPTRRTYSNLNKLRTNEPTSTTSIPQSTFSARKRSRPGLVRAESAAIAKHEDEYNDEAGEDSDELSVTKRTTQKYGALQRSTTKISDSDKLLSESSAPYSKFSFPTRKPSVLNPRSPTLNDESISNRNTFHEDQEDGVKSQVTVLPEIYETYGEKINNSQQTQIPKPSLRPLISLTSQATGPTNIIPNLPSSNSTGYNTPALTATTNENINTTNISVNGPSGNVLISKQLVGSAILDDNYNNDDDDGNNTQPLLHVKVVDDDSVENSRPLLLNFNRRFQKISSRRRGALDQVNSTTRSSTRTDQLANGSIATALTSDARNSSASTVSNRRRVAIYRVRRPLNNGTAVESNDSNKRRTYEDSNVRIRNQDRTSTRLTQTSTTETPPTIRRQEIRRRLVRKRPVSGNSTASTPTSSRRTTAEDDKKQNELLTGRQFESTTAPTTTRRRKVPVSTSTTERSPHEAREEILRATADSVDSVPRGRFRKVLRRIIRPGVNMTTVLPVLKTVPQDDGRIHLLKVGEISQNDTKEAEDTARKEASKTKEGTGTTNDQVSITNLAQKTNDQVSVTEDSVKIDLTRNITLPSGLASGSNNAGNSVVNTNGTLTEVTPFLATDSSTETNEPPGGSDAVHFSPKTNPSDTHTANDEPIITKTGSEGSDNVTNAFSTSSDSAISLNETLTDISTTTTIATTKSKLYASRRPYKPTKPSILAITSTESTSPTPKSYVRKYSTNFTSIKLPTEIDNPVGIITPKVPAVLKQSSKRYRQKPTTAKTAISQLDDHTDEEEEYDDDTELKDEEEPDAPHKVALIKPNYVLINRTPKAESHLDENPVQGLDSEEDEDDDTYIENERIQDLSRTNLNLPRPITSTVLGQPASPMLNLGIPGIAPPLIPTANPLDLLQMVLLPSQLPSAAPAQTVNAESGAVVRLNNGFVGVLQKSESKEDEADVETTTLKTTSTRRQPPHRITRPSNKPRVVNRPFVTTIHPASLRLAVTNPPKPTTPAPFRPNSTRNYERKYTATSSTESTLSDNSLLEDLNIDALNARNKKIFEQASRKHTTVKPKTTQKDLNGVEYNITNYNDTDLSSYNTTQLHQFNYSEEVLDANGINKFQESVLEHALHRPATPAPATSTTSKITTLHHVFELSEEDQATTEHLDSEEYFKIINNTVAKKLVEINRVVEIYSKQNVYKINISNHTTQNVSSTELKLEDLPRVDHIGEISRKALVNLVDSSARSSIEESRSREHAGSNILIEGRSTVAGNRPVEEISSTEFTPVRNSIPRYRTESTSRSGKADQRPFVPDVLTGVETSTISLEGLFELTRQGKSERVVNSPVYATSLGEVRPNKIREVARSINSPEHVTTAKPSTPLIDFTFAPETLAQTGLESTNREQSQRSGTTVPPTPTTNRTTTTIDRTSNYIRPPVPLLRPESNESSPLVISIANLDKVTLSKVPRDSSVATSGLVSTFVRPDGSALHSFRTHEDSASFNTDFDDTVQPQNQQQQQEPHYNPNNEPIIRSQLRPNSRRPVLSVRRRITPAASSNSTQDLAEPHRGDTGSPTTIGDSGSGAAGVTISSTSFTNRFNPRNRIRPATTTSTTEQPSVAPKVVVRRKFARPIKRTSTTTTTPKPSSSQAASETDADQDKDTEDVTSGNDARFTGGTIHTTNPLFRRRFSSTTPLSSTTPTSFDLELSNSPSVDQEIESSIQDTKFTNHRFNQIGENLEDEDNRKLVDAIKVMSNAPPPIGKEESITRRTGLVKIASNTVRTTAAPVTTKRVTVRRPQKTTQASTVTPLTARPVVRRRKPQKPEPFEKVNSRQSAGRTYRPVLDYDYYDDEDVRFVSKSNSQVKVVLHGRGLIECLDQGNFPHPLSCKKFISCAKMETGGVVGWEYTCPKGLSYDPVGGICNWSAGLGCKD